MWSRLPKANAGIAVVLCAASLALVSTNSDLIATAQEQHSALDGDAQSGVEIAPIPVPPNPNSIATQILHRALHEAVWGGAVACDIRQTVHMSEQKITSFGRLVRVGQGSGKLRMSLQISAGDRMNSLLQVSDGELLYSHVHIGDQVTRGRVDLGKVRDRLGTITVEALHDPVTAMYLAIGGQSEVLRKLSQQYEWQRVTENQLAGEPVWLLEGKLTYRPPATIADAEIDRSLFVENRSGLLPTHITVAVGRQGASVPYWLYQVEQRRDSTGLGENSALQVVTEWAAPKPLAASQLTPEWFQAVTSNESFVEETRRYLPPESTSSLAALPPLESPPDFLR